MRMALFVCLLFACAQVSCRTAGSGTEELTKPWHVDAKSLPKHWPKSTALESAWGKPSDPIRTVLGMPAVSYTDPSDAERYVQISYAGSEKPREIVNFDGRRAVDGQLSVMGQTVDYYSSGNEIVEISTHPLRLTARDGWSGWFVFTYSPKEHLGGRNLPAFSW